MAENEIYKTGTISTEIAPRTVGILKTSIQFSTGDNRTAKLFFNLSKGGSPLSLSSAVTAKVFLRMADGSVFENPVSVVDPLNGKLEYVLQDEISHPGLAKGELNVYYTNGQSLSVCKFSFNIDASLMDQDIVPLAEYYVKDFNTLQSDIQQRAAVINETVDEMQEKVDAFESTAVTLDPRLTTVEEKVATATTQLAESAKQLAVDTKVNASFLDLLESGQVTKIKLIGDSITQGQASTGGGEDPSGTPILTTTGGTIKREGYKTTPAWANFFRNFISSKYPAINFFNAGIGGWGAQTASQANYMTQWVGTNNDVVFVMLGTNDRTACANESEFENYLEVFCKHVEANSNHMYVMTASPTNNDFDANGVKTVGFNMTMEQIDKIITKVCVRNGWKHISFYRKMLEFQSYSGMSLDALLETNGGSHPLDQGHLLMWKTLQQELGIITNTYDWKTNKLNISGAIGQMGIWSGSGSNIFGITPIASFTTNQISMHYISSARGDLGTFPEAKGGNLVTYRGSNDDYAYQEYYVLGSAKMYTRSVSADRTGWTPWQDTRSIIFSGSTDSTTPISTYTSSAITYRTVSSSSADKDNLPEQTGGTLVTHRGTSDYFSWQEFHTLYTGNTYKRAVQSDLTWGAWKRVTENYRLSTTARQALSTVGLSIGDMVYDFTLFKPLWVRVIGTKEIDTLTISAGATTSGNITITLNGVAKTVAVAAGDTAGVIGNKIRATAFPGWAVGGAAGSSVVTFTKYSGGINTMPTFDDTGATGAAATFAVTTAGTNTTWVDATAATV